MDLLLQLVDFFAAHGYLAVLLALLLCGIGLPLPEDITLVAGGVIAGLGYANPHTMVAVALAGVLIGDLTMFEVGRHFGVHILRWRFTRRILTRKRFAAVQRNFERYGNRLLFAARFLPGMRAGVFITAGLTHRVSVWRFLLLDGLAALISVPLWVYLGHFGADNLDDLTRWVRRSQEGVWTVAIVSIAIIAIWVTIRRRRRRRAQRAAAGRESR